MLDRAFLGGPSTSPLDIVMRRLGLVLFVGTLALGGCLGRPYYVPIAPEVSGYLYIDGAPVVGADVYSQIRFESQQCAYTGSYDTTTAQGRFSLRASYAKTYDEKYTKAMAEFPWGLCIRYKHQWVVVYAEEHFGGKPRTMHLKCDLAARPVVGGQEGHGKGSAICVRDDV